MCSHAKGMGSPSRTRLSGFLRPSRPLFFVFWFLYGGGYRRWFGGEPPVGNGCLVVDLTGMSGQAPTLCPPSAGMRDPVAVNEEAVCPPNSGKGPSVAPSVTAPDSLLPCGKAKMVGIPPVGCDTDSSFVDLLVSYSRNG